MTPITLIISFTQRTNLRTRPMYVPFEWFEWPEPTQPGTNDAATKDATEKGAEEPNPETQAASRRIALLVWVNESGIEGGYVGCLTDLSRQLPPRFPKVLRGRAYP